MKYYYIKVVGMEEQWIAWSHWSSANLNDDGLYLTKNRIRACLFSEENLTDNMLKNQIGRYGTTTLILATDQEVAKYRSRIYANY